MNLRKVLALRGPNRWAQVPVVEAWVEFASGTPAPGPDGDALRARLAACLPDLPPEPATPGLEGLARLLVGVARELQRRAGAATEVRQVHPTSEPATWIVVLGYEEESTARACLESASALLVALRDGRPSDLEAEVRRLRKDHQWIALGPSTRSIVRAAVARGIPYRRLNEGSLVQFGFGARQRRILAAETDRTGAIAQEIAQDKELTRELLAAVGVPVPEGRPVADADDAWAAALEIGGPVVVKPQDGNQGRGVATDLVSREQVVAAYEAAREESRTGAVIVERFAPGGDYRLLVVGDRVVAAARREPARVVGDGVSTVARLVEAVNRDPRRGEDHATALSRIPLDAVSLGVLASQGLAPDSVPPAGRVVLIRRNANLSTGGTAEDVTDRVHPEVAARCVEAARMVGLDVAGIDVVAEDLGRPLEEQGGIVVEVNAAPGLRMHLEPSHGRPRPVGEAIVDLLFPPGDDGRIPIVGVTGVNGKTTTTRFIAHLLREAGRRVGMTCTDGVYIDGRRIEAGDCSGPASARAVLANPKVEAAVLETARGGMLRAGLGFDRCDVAVVTNIGEGDHLGISDVHTVADLARIKRILVENVAPGGAAVLNAADPLVASMAPHCPGSVILFAVDAEDPVVAAHRDRGGRAVIVRHGEVVLAEGARETGLVHLAEVPLTHGGRVAFQVENTLAAAGAAWALNLDLDILRAGLEGFAAALDTVPGRFNLLEIGGATVVVDYGHNISALAAILEAVEPLPHERRRILYSAAGDRRDEDMVRQGEMLAAAFDRVDLYEDAYTRGRAAGEIMALFRRGLAAGPRVREVGEHLGFFKALEVVLASVRRGDLLIVQADEIDPTVDFIRAYLASGAPGREIELAEAIETPGADAVLVGRLTD